MGRPDYLHFEHGDSPVLFPLQSSASHPRPWIHARQRGTQEWDDSSLHTTHGDMFLTWCVAYQNWRKRLHPLAESPLNKLDRNRPNSPIHPTLFQSHGLALKVGKYKPIVRGSCISSGHSGREPAGIRKKISQVLDKRRVHSGLSRLGTITIPRRSSRRLVLAIASSSRA